jgi:2-C-methyl-D-erythritol 4-phosphate cytidylyltransferase
MVEWSIEACRAAGSVGSIVVACPPGHVHELAEDNLGTVEGGATRAQSVSNALAAVGTELVAIHDAARPLVTPELVDEVVAALAADPEAAAAIAATPATDTIKRVAAGTKDAFTTQDGVNASLVIESTLDRSRLWAAQTPQVFRTAALREALAGAPDQVAAATDEAMLVEAVGGRVVIHPSPAENFKVTTPLDLELAGFLLGGRAS